MLNRILVYKRTHTGDPSLAGDFGVNDCMGKIREYDYDAVIGVGGIGDEPAKYGIQRKVNWVGIKSGQSPKLISARGDIIHFNEFVLLEHQGPYFEVLAPLLAKRLYEGRARFILSSLSQQELIEANRVIEYCLKLKPIKQLESNSLRCEPSCRP
ncbi:TPA: hypothetical protein RVR74_002281 [Aeromonas salmonicida]|nr:hypothetical protein [Aeromonas salmonicida]